MLRDEIKEKVNSYISGELTGAESVEVKKLIESDGEVKAYYEQTNEMLRLMDDFDDIEPKSDYQSQFWYKVEKEESSTRFSLFNIFNLNKKWAFAGSFGVFVVICSFVINSYVGNNGNGNYVNSLDDETLLTNLDESINPRTPDSLNIYGPWDDLEN
ncbi:MAG: hypothetical protein ACR2NC_02450 [Thermodesulfobacteriota bacterium]